MAKGKKCPNCRTTVMYAISEKDYPAGTEVVYECPNPPCENFREKVFEDN